MFSPPRPIIASSALWKQPTVLRSLREEFGVEPPSVHGIRFISVTHFCGSHPAPLRGTDLTQALLELGEDYMRTARAKELSARQALWRFG
mgnify:CR=1 FL=1